MTNVNRYIGARYVPVFADPIEWDNTRTYEPLTIVTRNGASYTSKQTVPVGIDITNGDYWVATGNYNAQVEAYRQEVQTFDSRITTLDNDLVTEADERILADGDLQDQITGLGSSITEMGANLNTAIENAQETANSANDAADAAQFSADTAQSGVNANTTSINNLTSEVDVLKSIIPPAQSQSVPYMSPAYIGDYESRYQSACVCKNGDRFYMFNATNWDDTGTLKVANIQTNDAPVDMLSHPRVGHANSCAFVPANIEAGTGNAIYLAPLRQYTGNGSYNSINELIKFNISGSGDQVSSTEIVTMPKSIMAVSYDHVTGKLWAFTGGSTTAANTQSVHTVYCKALDEVIFSEIGELRYENPYFKTDTDTSNRVLPQDIAVKDNIAFLCFNDGSGYTFDLRDVIANDYANPLACYRIGYISNSGIWQFGEVEGFEFDETGSLYQMRDCVLNIQESDNYTGRSDCNLRFSVVTSLAVGAKVQTDMSGDFGSYESVNLSQAVQSRFSLTGSQIRSINSLLLRVIPPSVVNIYQNVVESHTIRIVDDLNIKINTHSYQVGHIIHVNGRLQFFIQAGGELIVNRVAGENFIDGGTNNTELCISNRGTITIRNAIAHFYDFGYACNSLIITQFGTVTSNRFIWGDLTITNCGYWVGNHNIASWT